MVVPFPSVRRPSSKTLKRVVKVMVVVVGGGGGGGDDDDDDVYDSAH